MICVLSSANLSRVVPHGLLVFFPSFPLMEKTLEFWRVSADLSKNHCFYGVFVMMYLFWTFQKVSGLNVVMLSHLQYVCVCVLSHQAKGHADRIETIKPIFVEPKGKGTFTEVNVLLNNNNFINIYCGL